MAFCTYHSSIFSISFQQSNLRTHTINFIHASSARITHLLTHITVLLFSYEFLTIFFYFLPPIHLIQASLISYFLCILLYSSDFIYFFLCLYPSKIIVFSHFLFLLLVSTIKNNYKKKRIVVSKLLEDKYFIQPLLDVRSCFFIK